MQITNKRNMFSYISNSLHSQGVSKMNTKQLQSFVTVAKVHNIAETAKILDYSPSTIHAHLSSLEDELECKLYRRLSSGIVLTELGNQFLPYANEILTKYNEAMQTFSSSANSLKITASETSDNVVMKYLLDMFINKFPHIDIEYVKMITASSLSSIISGESDVAFICEQTEPVNPAIKVKHLCTIPLYLAAAPSHPAMKHGIKKSKILNTLLSTGSYKSNLTLFKLCNCKFDDYFNDSRNIGEMSIIKKLAIEGKGIALLPKEVILDELDNGSLELIQDSVLSFSNNIYIVVNSYKTQKKNTNDLIKMAVDLFK